MFLSSTLEDAYAVLGMLTYFRQVSLIFFVITVIMLGSSKIYRCQHWLREFTFIYLYFLQKIISRKLKNVLLFINLFKRLCTMVIYYWLNWNSIASYVAVLWSVRKFSFGATVTLSDIVLWESKWHIINRRIYFKYHDINVVSYKIILFSIIFYCYNLNHSLKEWDRY